MLGLYLRQLSQEYNLKVRSNRGISFFDLMINLTLIHGHEFCIERNNQEEALHVENDFHQSGKGTAPISNPWPKYILLPKFVPVQRLNYPAVAFGRGHVMRLMGLITS